MFERAVLWAWLKRGVCCDANEKACGYRFGDTIMRSCRVCRINIYGEVSQHLVCYLTKAELQSAKLDFRSGLGSALRTYGHCFSADSVSGMESQQCANGFDSVSRAAGL